MTEPRIVVHHTSMQGQDNCPHLTFFDRSSMQSFVWSGDPDQPIDVCAGGYAEDVSASFRLTDHPMLLSLWREVERPSLAGVHVSSLAEAVSQFGIICLVWITQVQA